MVVIAEDSVRFANYGPSHNLLRPALRNSYLAGPTPPHAREATEKLYERHCLVIKIVSSFFAYQTKFLYLYILIYNMLCLILRGK